MCNKIKNKSKLFIFVPVFFMISVSAYSVNDMGNICSVANVHNSETLKVINMGNQKIYTLFTPHLTSEIGDPVFDILFPLHFGHKLGIQTREYYETFKGLINERSDIVASEKNDAQTIIDLLSSDESDLKWIGIEIGEDKLEKGIDNQVDGYRKLKSDLSDVLTQAEIEDALYLIYDALAIMLAEYPELFEGIEIVPLDNDFYAGNSLRVYRAGLKALEDLYSRLITKAKSIENIERAEEIALTIINLGRVEDIAVKAIADTKKISQQFISEELNKWESEEDKLLITAFVENTNQFIEYKSKRDAAMASNILRQNGNGLVLLGSGHSKEVIHHLLSACRNFL